MSSTSESQAVNILSQGEILARLAHLWTCFDTLPLTLPDTTHSFQHFELSDEDIEDRGRVGALNHHLECTFCPQGRANGPFLLNGRGPGLLSLVDVLSAFIEDFPSDAILQKWVEDLIRAAEHTSSTTDPVGGSMVNSGVRGSTKKRGRPAGMVTEGQASKKALLARCDLRASFTVPLALRTVRPNSTQPQTPIKPTTAQDSRSTSRGTIYALRIFSHVLGFIANRRLHRRSMKRLAEGRHEPR
ncbi:hypothetical protein GSI_04975 [Ganoderma sinense ZZ0214-1]|uniref:Uncharacterized protein n=1 Tax=Ganoderma sinense ZZ0214-1 TaxID=1077348 RepID=A0A2G8SH17_9APHY|nr:hypothetical protein GSI_04975 [Ganoderma sinense ZZ0214-1]